MQRPSAFARILASADRALRQQYRCARRLSPRHDTSGDRGSSSASDCHVRKWRVEANQHAHNARHDHSIPTPATARSPRTTRASTAASSSACPRRASTAAPCARCGCRAARTAASFRARRPPKPPATGPACAAAPSLRPGTPVSMPPTQLARGAVSLIEDGVLDAGGIEHLATRVGVTSRHLRRIFESAVRRVADRVCADASAAAREAFAHRHALPVTEVALASGFASVRRFNALFRARYRMAPGRLRAHAEYGALPADAGVRARLPAALRLGRDARFPSRARGAGRRAHASDGYARSLAVEHRGAMHAGASRCGGHDASTRLRSSCRRRSPAPFPPCCRASSMRSI